MARWGSLVDVMSLFELKLSQSLLFSILGLAIFLSKISFSQHYIYVDTIFTKKNATLYVDNIARDF